MKKYKINILPEAIHDIISIKNDIIKNYHDNNSVKIVLDGIFDKIDSLSTFPRRAQIRLKISGYSFRFIKAGKYTVVYCIDSANNSVKIYGVFHSHRDIFEIIKKNNY